MLKNSQISHILLLCAIAYVIYCLTCPKTIKNSGTLEQINSSDGPVRSESPVSSESVTREESATESSVQSESSVSKGIVSERTK